LRTRKKVAEIDVNKQLAKAHAEIEEMDWEVNIERE